MAATCCCITIKTPTYILTFNDEHSTKLRQIPASTCSSAITTVRPACVAKVLQHASTTLRSINSSTASCLPLLTLSPFLRILWLSDVWCTAGLAGTACCHVRAAAAPEAGAAHGKAGAHAGRDQGASSSCSCSSKYTLAAAAAAQQQQAQQHSVPGGLAPACIPCQSHIHQPHPCALTLFALLYVAGVAGGARQAAC